MAQRMMNPTLSRPRRERARAPAHQQRTPPSSNPVAGDWAVGRRMAKPDPGERGMDSQSRSVWRYGGQPRSGDAKRAPGATPTYHNHVGRMASQRTFEDPEDPFMQSPQCREGQPREITGQSPESMKRRSPSQASPQTVPVGLDFPSPTPVSIKPLLTEELA